MKNYFSIITIVLFFIANFSSPFVQKVSANDSILQVVGQSDYPPYSFINEKGEPDGFEIDLFKAVAEKLHWRYTLRLMNWTDALNTLNSGEADILLSTLYTDSRADRYSFSLVTSTSRYCIVTKDTSKFKQLADLNGKKIIVLADDFTTDYMRENDIHAGEIAEYPDYASAIAALDSSGFDACLCNYNVCQRLKQYISDLGLSIVPDTFIPTESCFATLRNKEYIRDIDLAIYQTKETGEFQDLQNKWFHGFNKEEFIFHTHLMIAVIIIILLIVSFSIYLIMARINKKRLTDRTFKMDIAIKGSHIAIWDFDVKKREYISKIHDDSDEIYHVPLELYKQNIHPDDIANVNPIWDLMLSQRNETFTFETRFRYQSRPELDWQYATIYGAPFKINKKGEVVRYSGFLRNDTIWKNINEELQKAKEKAEESNTLKSAFLANMSHEIRTPLNAIVGFSQLLVDAESNEEKEQYDQIIRSNNELLLQLINDVLDLSKIEAGMIEFVVKPFNMADLFKETYLNQKQRAENSNVELICVSPYKSCIISCDRNRISQVLNNFLTNAMKFTQSGYIKFGYQSVKSGISIYCEDSGIGMSEEQCAKVFERFYKANSFMQGTGLGMSICKGIADTMGGEISVESKSGVGTTFSFWFPCECKIDN